MSSSDSDNDVPRISERFYVVEFFGENTVEAIPCNWLQNGSVQTDETGKPIRGKCWWPPVKSVSKLARTRATPNLETWTLFSVKLVRYYDSYEKARLKSIKYEVDSELNTASENDAKRKRFGNTKYDDGTEDEDRAFLTGLPPKFPKQSAAGVGFSRRGSQPVGNQYKICSASQSRLVDENSFPLHPVPPHPVPLHPVPLHPVPHHPVHMADQSPQGTSVWNVEGANVATPHSNYRMLESAVNLAETSFGPRKKTPHCCSHNEGFQRKVLTLLEELKRDVAILMRERHTSESKQQLPPQCPALPLQMVEDITLLEHLLNDTDFFNSVGLFLSVIGGVSIKDCTKRILARMVSAPLSARYNWKGSRGTKLPFSNLANIMRLITFAVRATHPGATESVVATILKSWLMHAADRDGSRTK